MEELKCPQCGNNKWHIEYENGRIVRAISVAVNEFEPFVIELPERLKLKFKCLECGYEEEVGYNLEGGDKDEEE